MTDQPETARPPAAEERCGSGHLIRTPDHPCDHEAGFAEEARRRGLDPDLVRRAGWTAADSPD